MTAREELLKHVESQLLKFEDHIKASRSFPNNIWGTVQRRESLETAEDIEREINRSIKHYLGGV